eukprot:4039431-Amphidinium_carterae.2
MCVLVPKESARKDNMNTGSWQKFDQILHPDHQCMRPHQEQGDRVRHTNYRRPPHLDLVAV